MKFWIIKMFAFICLLTTYIQGESVLDKVAFFKVTDERQPYIEQFTFEVDELAEDSFDDDLQKFLCNAIRAEDVTEKLISISTESQMLNDWEKVAVISESNDGILAQYHKEKGNSDDEWYKVTLHTQDDIVIRHLEEDGSVINYYFHNNGGTGKTYERAMRSGGHMEEKLYFVQWNDNNYLVTLYENNSFIKMVVYDYRTCRVMCITLEETQKITVSFQICNVGFSGGAYWP